MQERTPFTLAAILGHSDIRMTAHATDEAKRRAVDRLVAPVTLETRPLPQAVLTAGDTHVPLAPSAGETPAFPVGELRLPGKTDAFNQRSFGKRK